MNIIKPGNHPAADKFWETVLNKKPNGARTLGDAQAKWLAKCFEPYYDLLVTYASEYDFDIPEGTKRIAIMTHQNFPWVAGLRSWQKVNNKLQGYEVDYFINEQNLINLVKEAGGRAFYLPRFIDATKYPRFLHEKDIETLWFGNAWGEFQGEFAMYKNTVKNPVWITHGNFGAGDKTIRSLSRMETLAILARAKEVWAIGISQLEAQLYNCDIVSYRGPVLPYYDQKTIVPYTKELLNKIWSEKNPTLGN